ncbi:MAG TPA: C45 family autoproteolytic acyltransferase/hydrolase [Phycisphaerae bacterium]|nr:C45 family autoproteolytic acyltransferase/hydrolase [Phycisphaerae bacterium]
MRNIAAASQQPGIATQLRLDVHALSRSDDATILNATRELADRLRATGEFGIVWTGVSTPELAAAYQHLLSQGPALLTEEEQKEIEFRASRDYLTKRFAAVRTKLADPDGEILLAQAKSDPLDIGGILAHRLQQLSPVGDQNNRAATMQDGILVMRDDTSSLHAMIVAEPRSLPSDQKAAEKTLLATHAAIDAVQKEFASGHPIGVWMVGAHRGYVENAHRVMRDVMWVSIIGTIAVGVAIALYFRRLSTALLCIIPATVGVGIALGLAGLFHLELPLLLLGFSGLLCGSTTDYGIQIISEMKRLAAAKGGWFPSISAIAARRMMGPISMSVATSVTGFAALGLSESPGLRALGLFVAAATICIWLVTFLILPVYLGPWVLAASHRSAASRPNSLSCAIGWCGFVAFALVTCCLGLQALKVHFNTDPRSLDGSSAEMRAEEDAFFKVWGDLRDRAVVITRGDSAESALAGSSRAAEYCENLVRDTQVQGVISPAGPNGILPDQGTVVARIALWRAYWTPERLAALRSALADAAIANGFKAASFSPYATRIADISRESPEERIRTSPVALFPGFIDSSTHGVSLATIVEMRTDRTPRLETGWAQELRLRIPDAIILSGKMLAFDATERSRAEGERLAPWCCLAILLPLWLYFRRLRRAWLVMLCMLVGFVWVLGSAQIFGGGLNLLSLVPILFTLGVAVDYGIYATSGPSLSGKDAAPEASESTPPSRLSANFLCAFTTIVGSGSLIIASHPAMRWLGITLVAGVSGGYLASLFIVTPAVRRPSRSPEASANRRWTHRLAAGAASAFVAILTCLLAGPVAAEWLLRREHPTAHPVIVPLTATEVSPGTYQAGDSWMRWHSTSRQAGIWEMAVAGTPEERGAALAALASPIDVRIENEMLDQLDLLVPEEWARWTLLRAMGTNLLTLPSHVPAEYQRELYAAATSYDDPHAYLAPAYPRILAYHALHDVSQMLIDNPLIVPTQFACTGIISLPGYTRSNGGDLMLGRVFDFEGGESFGRQKSLTCVIPPIGEGIPFAHVAWPGLAGCVTGMNADKIALFINAAATRDFRRIGTPTIFVARDVLEHCHTLDEAEQVIRKAEVFVSDIIVVADGKTGRARVFEKSPAATSAYDVDASAVVTNHLITPRFASDPVNVERMSEGTTMQRYARARQLLDRLKGNVKPESLAEVMRDKKGLDAQDIGYGNRNAIDGLIACHAVIMDVTKGEMWIAGWPNCEGEFVGVDVLKTLKDARANPACVAEATPPLITEDAIMHDGTWERILESRTADRRAIDALKSGNETDALNAAQASVAANPHFYFGHELLGRVFLRRGDTTRAAQEFKTALSLSPPYAARIAELRTLLRKAEISR